MLPQPFALTEDGHEQIWQVNYLSHTLLVELLLPVLERSGGRVVLVSSLVHHLGYRGGIRWEAVDSPVGFVPWKAYSQSKLALLLHAKALGACSIVPAQLAPDNCFTHRLARIVASCLQM